MLRRPSLLSVFFGDGCAQWISSPNNSPRGAEGEVGAGRDRTLSALSYGPAASGRSVENRCIATSLFETSGNFGSFVTLGMNENQCPPQYPSRQRNGTERAFAAAAPANDGSQKIAMNGRPTTNVLSGGNKRERFWNCRRRSGAFQQVDRPRSAFVISLLASKIIVHNV